MSNLLNTLLFEFKEKLIATEKSWHRDASFPEVPEKIKVALGMRRSGKTYFLLQTIAKLINEQHIPLQRILYLNFEDDRLLPCTQDNFRDLLDGFYRLYPDNHDQLCYLFLDEVQNVENWALVIRRIFDTKKVQVFLSGSSAKLLSKEIATELRGRSIATEIWPLSFKEYLNVHDAVIQTDLFAQKTHDLLFHYLKNYMATGGFPEIQNLSIGDSRQILQDYVELVIMKDIIERHNITNISLIKYIVQTMIKNPATGFSVNKFANDVKSQGLSGAKNTISDYLSYLEDAYLIFSVSLFSESIRKTESNPKKMYAIDTGLVKAFSFSFTENHGHLFENMFFLDLKRTGHKIYYYLTKERYEVDFLVEDRLGEKKLYQVVWDCRDKETLDREMRALKIAEEELGIKGALITPENYLETIWHEMRIT